MSKRKEPGNSSAPSVSYCWLVAKTLLGNFLKGVKTGVDHGMSCFDPPQVVGRLELLVAVVVWAASPC